MDKLPNVAFIGYMRSGKTSVAECLHALHPLEPIVNLSFARALKSEVARALNATRVSGDPIFTAEFFEDEKNRALYRPLLQWYGTEYRRARDPKHWVRKIEAEVTRLDGTLGMTCTDARFLNELEMLRERDFKIILLDLAVEELIDYLESTGLTRQQINQQVGHVSEQEWQQFKPDFRVDSRFGNLPNLTYEVLAYLTGKVPDKDAIEAYYQQRYPRIYK